MVHLNVISSINNLQNYFLLYKFSVTLVQHLSFNSSLRKMRSNTINALVLLSALTVLFHQTVECSKDNQVLVKSVSINHEGVNFIFVDYCAICGQCSANWSLQLSKVLFRKQKISVIKVL